MAELFQIVQEPEPSPTEAATPPKPDFNTQALFLALSALSKRALIAIDNLFTLLTVLSVFWLALSLSNPNSNQLIEMGGYALFVLAANVIVRRK